METLLKYKSFKHAKGEDELTHEIKSWQIHLNFMQVEIDFLKQLIQTYPFKNKMLNLFERVQLFVDELNKYTQEKNTIFENVKQHKKVLNNMPECTDLYCDNYYNEQHETIAATIFELEQRYASFKTELYNYISGNTS